MLSKTMEDALNDQLVAEFYSAYLYLAMTAWFENKGLGNFAAWLHAQAVEELQHGEKFFRFINDRNGRIRLGAIDAPKSEWSSPTDVFEAAYQHECHISDRINKLVDLAHKEGDHATRAFLVWFLNEQVEEEAIVSNILDKLRLAGDDGRSLLIIDQELTRGSGGEG